MQSLWLVAYDGDSSASDSEETAENNRVQVGLNHDRSLNISNESPDPALTSVGPSTSTIKIKRPQLGSKIKKNIKGHARLHVSEDASESSSQELSVASVSSNSAEQQQPDDDERQLDIEHEDELAVLRKLLRPPDIPDVQDWGIPPESDKPCDPAIATKLLQFHALKSGATPKHFNDSLMSNQSFHNPHLYTKLVEFVEIGDESVGCYHHHATSPSSWDGLFGHGQEEWDWNAEKIAQFQKTREQQQSQSQSSSSQTQRKQIDFTSAKHKDKGVARQGIGREKDKEKVRYNPYVSTNQKWKGKWG